MAKQTAVVPKNIVEAVAADTGLSVEKVQHGVTMFDGEPYFGQEFCEMALEHRFGAKNFSIEVEMLTLDEYRMMREMSGIRPGEPYFVMRCRITIRGYQRPFIEYGTAHKGNTKMISAGSYGMELASTRARTRCMKLAIGHGFAVNAPYEPPSAEEASAALFDADQRPALPMGAAFKPQTGSPQAKFLADCGEIKKRLGDDAYYTILGNYGIEHSNDRALMDDLALMRQVWDDLRAAAGIESSDETADVMGRMEALRTDLLECPEKWQNQFEGEIEGMEVSRLEWWEKRVAGRLNKASDVYDPPVDAVPAENKKHEPLPGDWHETVDVGHVDFDLYDMINRGASLGVLAGLYAKHPALSGKNFKDPSITDGQAMETYVLDSGASRDQKVAALERADNAVRAFNVKANAK